MPNPRHAAALTWSPFINLVGIELEGAWDGQRPENLHGDGSVEISGYDASDCDCDDPDDCNCQARTARIVGESSSPPLAISAVSAWIERNYPDETNSSCGLHVHISLRELSYYTRLMEPAFYTRVFIPTMTHFCNAIRHSGDRALFTARLRGDNHFCQDMTMSVIQANYLRGTDRYTQLNYDYRQFGTVECRLFPMFSTATRASRAVHAYLRCVHTYLAGISEKKMSVHKTAIVSPADLARLSTLPYRSVQDRTASTDDPYLERD